ncbi:MAG: glycerophosphoryl diester phosphodiesterase membrane domain-containing protein [Erythrobacter sp.]|jgi:hypothetical protein
MKFNLDTAWREATRLVSDNAGLLSAIAGIFVFLPYATLLLVLPSIAPLPQLPEGADFDVALKAIEAFYAQTWWAFVAAGIVVTIGLISMIALVGRQDRPTVGQAIAIGLKSIVPAWLTLFVQNMAINIAVAAIVAIASATGLAALIFVATLSAIALALYLGTRLSLVTPIIAVDGELNPFRVIAASWALTRGHGSRLVLFYVLLALAAIVVISVVMLVIGVGLALGGPAFEEAGGALVSAAMMAGVVILITAVMAAVHRQLHRLAQARAGVARSSDS